MSAFDPIPKSVHVDRRGRIAERLGRDVLLLPAAPQRHSSRDTEYPYRPDSDLAWATGLTEPDTLLVMVGTGGGDYRTELFMRPRDPEAERWAGRRMGPEMAAEWTGADASHSIEQLGEVLPGLLHRADRIHYRLGAGPAPLEQLVRDALEWRRGRGARDGRGPMALVDPGRLLDPLRLRKDRWEIERHRHAVSITMSAFRATMAAARPGVGEYELEAVLEHGFRVAGSAGPAYPSIVGSGENGCVLHYVENSAVVSGDDLVLIDAGATWDLYTADLTRTFPVSGRFTSEQLDLYQVVEAARAAAVESARPGGTLAEVHDTATMKLVEGMVSLGILEGEPEDLVDGGAHRAFYPHQTAHWLGLDVHDVGDYATDGVPTALEAGMLFTVEPGLYIPPGAEGGAARFAGTGIRIEDDLLVTEAGVENLSADLPTDPERLVELIGEAG